MAPRTLFAALFAALLTTVPLSDVRAGDGILTANAYRPFHGENTVSVKAWDNSDQNLAIAQEIEARLEAMGYVVSDKANIALFLEINPLTGTWTDGERRHLLELEGHGGREGGENACVRLNLFSSESGGVLNKGRPGQPNTVSRYLMEFMLDPKLGPRLGEGQVAVEYTGGDPTALLKRMVPEMLPLWRRQCADAGSACLRLMKLLI